MILFLNNVFNLSKMKKIIILFALFCSTNLYAQNTVPIPSDPPICNYLQLFTGEWMYANGLDTVRIYLRYHECLFASNTTEPEIRGRLWGWHEYKTGNSVVESNYQYRFENLPTDFDNSDINKTSILLSMPGCIPQNKKLKGTIIDYSVENQLMKVSATFDSTFNRLSWSQQRSEAYGLATDARGMTLPKDFVLIKQ
jgi:hypothetical protein